MSEKPAGRLLDFAGIVNQSGRRWKNSQRSKKRRSANLQTTNPASGNSHFSEN